MATARDILNKKGTAVATISGKANVVEAAEQMNQQRIGSLVVMDGEQIVGIFTERDILTKIVAAKRDPAHVKVREVMSTPVAYCRLDTTAEECRTVMTSKRIRHLPVVDGQKLVGIITSGDLMAREVAEHQETIEVLQLYIHGPY